jgi:hypothetical protein
MENINMKTNFTIIALFAVLALFAVSFASASLVQDLEVKINGDEITINSDDVLAYAGDVVPVTVKFEASANASDVTVTVELDGYDDESNEFDTIAGKTYRKTFNVEIPTDADDDNKEYTMHVTIDSNGNEELREAYTITIARDDHTFDVLSVDYNTRVTEGEVFPVSVVVENSGSNEAENVYVIVSIPALDITTRGYLGDLFPFDNYADDNDNEDAMQETVLLQIPAEAITGLYDLVVTVYNDDAEVKTSSLISVTGSAIVDEEVNAAEDSESEGVSTSIIALTVVLVIIFVVLLAVLVVLVTRKDKEIEEAETSYY